MSFIVWKSTSFKMASISCSEAASLLDAFEIPVVTLRFEPSCVRELIHLVHSFFAVLEYVGPKWRTFVANMSIALFFTFAASILPWIAWFCPDWRVLCYVTSAPLAIALFTPWFVPESARWLVSQGKIDKAIAILRKFERINGTKVDDKVYKQFKVRAVRRLRKRCSNFRFGSGQLRESPEAGGK